jgi:hypothetical protein
MNKTILQNELEQAGINPLFYSLDGDERDLSLILNQLPYGRWEVYYSERGNRFDLHSFNSEAEACEYFREVMLRDPTTRKYSGQRA